MISTGHNFDRAYPLIYSGLPTIAIFPATRMGTTAVLFGKSAPKWAQIQPDPKLIARLAELGISLGIGMIYPGCGR